MTHFNRSQRTRAKAAVTGHLRAVGLQVTPVGLTRDSVFINAHEDGVALIASPGQWPTVRDAMDEGDYTKSQRPGTDPDFTAAGHILGIPVTVAVVYPAGVSA